MNQRPPLLDRIKELIHWRRKTVLPPQAYALEALGQQEFSTHHDPMQMAEHETIRESLTTLAELLERPSQQTPPGWTIAETGAGEIVIHSPDPNVGHMTIPAGEDGSTAVRLLRALSKEILKSTCPTEGAEKQNFARPGRPQE